MSKRILTAIGNTMIGPFKPETLMHLNPAWSLCGLLAFGLLTLGCAGPPSAGVNCGEIQGLDPLLATGNILVFGEIHGSQESPELVANVVCAALQSRRSVTLALELLDSEAPAIETFLGSEGSESDRDRLIAKGAWSAGYQDGRTSLAMLELLDRARIYRTGGLPIGVELFDRRGWRSGQERDRLMARALAKVLDTSTADLLIVLTGNIHSRVVQGTPWDPTYEPMAYLLASQTERRLVSLNVAHGGGSVWMCNGNTASSCGMRELPRREEARSWSIELGDDPAITGHHGSYHVGVINASLPAQSQ